MTDTEIIKQVVFETLRQLGKLDKTINKAEAYRRYPRNDIDRLTKNATLKWIQHTENGSKYIEVTHLDEVMKSNNVLNKFKNENHKRTNRRNVKG